MSFQWLRRYFRAVTMIYNDHFLMWASWKCRGDDNSYLWAILFPILNNKGVFWHHYQLCLKWLHDSSGFTRNKWPPNFKASVAIRVVFYMAHANSLKSGKPQRCSAPLQQSGQFNIANQKQTHEQIENVLFQSDPICTAIYLGSKGTILENGGRKACEFFEQQCITWKGPEPKPEMENIQSQNENSDFNHLWSTVF